MSWVQQLKPVKFNIRRQPFNWLFCSSRKWNTCIIIGPEWWGRNEYTEQRNLLNTAMRLLRLTCMAININRSSSIWMDDADIWRVITDRANAALQTLAAQPEVKNWLQLAFAMVVKLY